MFTRTHQIRRYTYTEALQSYRDRGQPRHRCIARWRADRSLADEIGRTQWTIELASENIAFWQGLLDQIVCPRFPEQVYRAPEYLEHWRRSLETARAHLAALTKARAGLPPVSDADIELAMQEAARRTWDSLRCRARPSRERGGDRGVSWWHLA